MKAFMKISSLRYFIINFTSVDNSNYMYMYMYIST